MYYFAIYLSNKVWQSNKLLNVTIEQKGVWYGTKDYGSAEKDAISS